MAATTIAFTSAITSNFIWNRYWTYPDSRSRPISRQLVQFFAVNIAGWIFRSIIVILLYSTFGSLASEAINTLRPDTILTQTARDQVGTNLAQALAVVVVMFWNFFVNRYWTYNDVE
jgi:putative flippase GtrA